MRICLIKVDLPDSPVPSKSSFNSFRWSRLSFLIWRSISWLMRRCSRASADMQQAIFYYDDVFRFGLDDKFDVVFGLLDLIESWLMSLEYVFKMFK